MPHASVSKQLSYFCLAIAGLMFICSAKALNAQTVTFTDKENYQWDLTSGGRIYNGYSNTFDSAPYLQINNSSFTGMGKKDPKNTRLMVFGPQDISGFKITRKTYVPEDFAGLIFLDRIENTSSQKAPLDLRNWWNMGYTITDYKTGKQHKFGLSEVAYSQSSTSGASTGFKIKSDLSDFSVKLNYSSDDLYVNFSRVEMEPGQVATFMHAVVQRKSTAEALKAVQSLKLSDYVHVFEKDGMHLMNVLRLNDVFDLSPLKLFRGKNHDQIELTTGESLSGELATSDLEIQTDFGPFTFNTDHLISVLNMGYKRYLFVLKDGTCVLGSPAFKTLKWRFMGEELSEIEMAYVSKLGIKISQTGKPFEWFDFKQPVLSLRSGDRLVGKLQQESLQLATDYGLLALPISKLHRIDFPDKKLPVSAVHLVDGSILSGVLMGDISIELIDGKTVSVASGNLGTVYFPSPLVRTAEVKSKLTLLRKDQLNARLKNDAVIEVNTPLGLRSIAGAQIKRITIAKKLGTGVELILWNDTKVPGRLKSSHLPFIYLEDKQLNLPAGLLRDYQSPHTLPPDEIAEKVKVLIKALGDSKLSVRSEAEKELASYGATIRGLLLQFKKSEDLETKMRVEAILSKMPK